MKERISLRRRRMEPILSPMQRRSAKGVAKPTMPPTNDSSSTVAPYVERRATLLPGVTKGMMLSNPRIKAKGRLTTWKIII